VARRQQHLGGRERNVNTRGQAGPEARTEVARIGQRSRARMFKPGSATAARRESGDVARRGPGPRSSPGVRWRDGRARTCTFARTALPLVGRRDRPGDLGEQPPSRRALAVEVRRTKSVGSRCGVARGPAGARPLVTRSEGNAPPNLLAKGGRGLGTPAGARRSPCPLRSVSPSRSKAGREDLPGRRPRPSTSCARPACYEVPCGREPRPRITTVPVACSRGPANRVSIWPGVRFVTKARAGGLRAHDRASGLGPRRDQAPGRGVAAGPPRTTPWCSFRFGRRGRPSRRRKNTCRRSVRRARAAGTLNDSGTWLVDAERGCRSARRQRLVRVVGHFAGVHHVLQAALPTTGLSSTCRRGPPPPLLPAARFAGAVAPQHVAGPRRRLPS